MGPVGHLAIGFAIKPAALKTSPWVLLLASLTLDILCFVFVLFGIEYVSLNFNEFIQGNIVLSVPWSHGLFMSIIWASIALGVSFLIFHNSKEAILVGLVVFSHWILGFVVHPPDLPLLFSGSPMVGLGLWNSFPRIVISQILEFTLLAGGIIIFMKTKKKFAN